MNRSNAFLPKQKISWSFHGFLKKQQPEGNLITRRKTLKKYHKTLIHFRIVSVHRK